MYFIAAITGLFAGAFVWYVLTYFVVHSILWAEARNPQLVGSKSIRVGQFLACVTIFILCVSAAIWVGHLLWIQAKQ